MLNGLDLFSGIGGAAIALDGLVRPVAYCERVRSAQAILLTRMAAGDIPTAPIWDDVSTLRVSDIPHTIDIITGGFPCQDISVAGRGAGLAGERSGLFWEIIRIAGDIREHSGCLPWLYLENVPAITTRGGLDVVGAITQMGYDCRWGIVSAADVGAPHRRQRWWLLGYPNHHGQPTAKIVRGVIKRGHRGTPWKSKACQSEGSGEQSAKLAITQSQRIQRQRPVRQQKPQSHDGERLPLRQSQRPDWWTTEPPLDRVVNGLPNRAHRIWGLGNAWVPLQARTALEILLTAKATD